MATTETVEERRARIHAGVARGFEESVRQHFDSPPETWFVEKAGDRVWAVKTSHGVLDTFKRKSDAEDAITNPGSIQNRLWHERSAWYRQETNDPRLRPLKDYEVEIVERVLTDLGAEEN